MASSSSESGPKPGTSSSESAGGSSAGGSSAGGSSAGGSSAGGSGSGGGVTFLVVLVLLLLRLLPLLPLALGIADGGPMPLVRLPPPLELDVFVISLVIDPAPGGPIFGRPPLLLELDELELDEL